MPSSRKRDTSPKSEPLDSVSAKRVRVGMVEEPKVSLEFEHGAETHSSLQSDDIFHRNTDNSGGSNSLQVSQNCIDTKTDPSTREEQSKPCGSQYLIVEVFSGSCRLSKACRKVGFRTTAIDKSSERSENFTIYKCDLTNPAELKLLKEYFIAEQDALLHLHFAPSCGTSSRARERPIKGLPKHQQPVPLRSESCPDGLPHLSPRDQQRVHLANLTYDATAELVLLLVSLMVSVSIENPANSLFWLYTAIRKLLQQVGGHMTTFDSCMHGGLRDKSTGWWSSNPRCPDKNLFESLAMRCDNSHKHASWKPYKLNGLLQFPTAQEAAYPQVLCDRVAHVLLEEAKRCNLFVPQNLQEQLESNVNVAKRQLFANQPRGQRLRPLVSEFGHYATMVLAAAQSDEIQDGFCGTA